MTSSSSKTIEIHYAEAAKSKRSVRETLTLAEIADRLGLGKTTAYELARRNELPVPAIRIGRQYFFSRAAFEDLMSAQHQERATTEAH